MHREEKRNGSTDARETIRRRRPEWGGRENSPFFYHAFILDSGSVGSWAVCLNECVDERVDGREKEGEEGERAWVF